MNNKKTSLLDQFTPSQLNRLRLAPTLADKESLVRQFKQQNQAETASEIQQGLDELSQQIANLRRPTSRFGSMPMDSAQRKRFIAQLESGSLDAHTGTEAGDELDD